MENVSLELSGYFKRLDRLLDCPKALRRPFLEQTRRMAEDYVQGNPDATPQDIAGFLGDPQELAQGFLETLDPEVIARHRKRKKLLRWGCVAILAAVLVIVTMWAIHLWNRPTAVETTETVVIQGDLTYAETMEEQR